MQISNGSVLIEWPSDCQGCALEETTTLGPGATWLRSQFQPQPNGNRYQVTIPTGTGNKFYRLSR
jgi:hypothetical protein